MPSPPLSNSFEGGTDGTVLTTGNTGAGSGDAASAVVDPNSIQKFSTAQAAHGTVSMIISQTAAPAATYWQWTALGTILTSVWFRCYIYLPALPSATFPFMLVKNQAGGGCAEYRITNLGKVTAVNAAGTTIQTGTVTVNTNAWFRVEMRVFPSTTVGELEWRLFNTPDSYVADEAPAKATAVVLGANVGQVWWGQPFGPPASLVSRYDDVAVSQIDWLGPYGYPRYADTFNPIPFQGQGRNL
jgi:hypothetical protein